MAALLASFRSLVLPREHGSWSLALEPVALGLLVAPTRAGGWLALAAAAAFLARRPLKLTLTTPAADPRRLAAARWAALLTALALLSVTFVVSAPHPANLRNTQNWPSPSTSVQTAPDAPPPPAAMLRNTQHWSAATLPSLASLWPLLLAVPFGAAFLWFDRRGEMRAAEAELCGSLTFALLPATFATLAGWSAGAALGLATAMVVRSAPTVLTVRAYLRIAKGQRASAWLPIGAAGAGLAALVILQRDGLVPLLVPVAGAGLALRSAWLLSRWAPRWSARRVGTLEAVLGGAFLVALTVAYRTT